LIDRRQNWVAVCSMLNYWLSIKQLLTKYKSLCFKAEVDIGGSRPLFKTLCFDTTCFQLVNS
jgi:hypothetical protein